MVIDAGNEEKPPMKLLALDYVWVVILLLGNVLPLLFWDRIELWTQASLLYAGR